MNVACGRARPHARALPAPYHAPPPFLAPLPLIHPAFLSRPWLKAPQKSWRARSPRLARLLVGETGEGFYRLADVLAGEVRGAELAGGNLLDTTARQIRTVSARTTSSAIRALVFFFFMDSARNVYLNYARCVCFMSGADSGLPYFEKTPRNNPELLVMS